MSVTTPPGIPGWDLLAHGGLLLDTQRQKDLAEHVVQDLPWFHEQELRRRVLALSLNDRKARTELGEFVSFVLHTACGFPAEGWLRGSQVPSEWSRRTLTGEMQKPRHLWRGHHGATLPVFFDAEPRLGIGKSRQTISRVLQWLRAGTERLALVTNGSEWRLVFAGIDFDAYCQWDADAWLEQGALSPQFAAFRQLIAPALWTPSAADAPAPLLAAIHDSRKGQADLSAALGERVREAVEVLVQGHGDVLLERCAGVDPADIYRAAVRLVMRMVVVLFSESRELLPRTNPLYHSAYGLQGLREELARLHARGTGRLGRSWNAWPRILALFRLVHDGSHHPALPVHAYGGELFAPGDRDAKDGITQAVAVFEDACFDTEVLPDRDVHCMLELITRTEVKVRQGKSSVRVKTAIDFSDLSSEYIGILYEGLLDFELRTAPAGDPIVFLAVGNEPALPMSRLEAMSEKDLKSLFEKLQKAGKPESDDADSNEESDDEEGDASAEDDVETAEPESDETEEDAEPDTESDDDVRHTHRSRAETWARKAVDATGLVTKPRGRLTPEKKLAFDHEVGLRARQLVDRVVLPGEWYLVRWGGTRKGSGTFYTRPGLAVPTVQRALRPLAYIAPTDSDGQPDELAAASTWLPKLPEEILALKVCDPACGSGSFLVAALRFLCEALYVSLHTHGRIQQDGERALVQLLGKPSASGGKDGDELGAELLPCRPDDPTFEARLKAVLRRYVVEHCVYGVDLDPLAVELCRLALWIETMDRELPFTFLDHKLRPGDGLIGTWIDRFRDYPLMAWARQSPDEKWRGVTHPGDVWAKALKAQKKKVIEEQADLLRAQQRLGRAGIADAELQQALEELRGLYARMHAVPPSRPDERARIWRDEVLCHPALHRVKSACDLWTALWFWPLDRLNDAPGPMDLASPSRCAQEIVEQLAQKRRFFHWELEFPDVFVGEGAGFDAVVGNPPWETWQPQSKEFFSDLDPLYRSYGKQDGLRRQRELFDEKSGIELRWLDYVGGFKSLANFVSHAAEPFGDAEDSQGRLLVGLVPRKADESKNLHERWARLRKEKRGLSDPAHAFRHQGEGKAYSYKLFVEQAHALLREGGHMALITPSGLYTDKGSVDLRRLLLEQCQWRWLYGFENRDKLFDIHRSFKFAVTIAKKGGHTQAIRAAFMRHDLGDWAEAKGVIDYPAERVHAFSPKSLSVLEIRDERDLALLTKIYANSVLLGDDDLDGWGIKYAQGDFNMTSDSKLFIARDKAEVAGYRADEYGRWIGPEGDVLLPLYQGSMVHQHDPSFKGWFAIEDEKTKWNFIRPEEKRLVPKYLVRESDYVASAKVSRGLKVGFRDIARSTDERTSIAALVPDLPCGNVVGVFSLPEAMAPSLVAVMSSLAFDFAARVRISGTHMNYYVVDELPLPRNSIVAGKLIAGWAARVGMLLAGFAPWWNREWPQWRARWAILDSERLRVRAMLDALMAAAMGVDRDGLGWMMRDCDHPVQAMADKAFRRSLDPKGFWRTDKEKDPELRHTVLAVVAFHALQELIDEHGGDRDQGIAAFLAQNGEEGWLLPETLCLADYGLGHDDRAQHPQPVASRLGPRFLDWQLAESPEQSWSECERQAKAVLGDEEFARRFSPRKPQEHKGVHVAPILVARPVKPKAGPEQRSLFDEPKDPSKSDPEPLPLTISSIRLLNFRNWKDEHWQKGVELCPVTLVLGRNSAGKTSILQPLRMLKQTIESTDSGIHLNLGAGVSDGLNLGAFADVVHDHDEGLEVGVGVDIGDVTVDVRFALVGGRPTTTSLTYRMGGERVEIERTPNAYKLHSPGFRLPNWDGAKDVHEPQKAYEPGRAIEVSEKALIDLGPTLGPKLRSAVLVVKEAFKKFHYLGPLRPPPSREVTWSQQDPTRLGSTGGETVQALIGSTNRRGAAPLLKSASKWLKRLDLADAVEVKRLGSSLLYQIEIVRGKRRANLVDVGYGVSQILPVIVLLQFVPEGSVILCEDPEAHLHPIAQAGLADMFVEVAKERRLQVLVETHSEPLFRRLQFLVADEQVQSADCALYHVERDDPDARLARLEVDEFGNVSNWPQDFFGDEMRDLVGRSEAQARRVKKRGDGK